MANIRVDVNYAIKDGSEIVFRSPVDCSAITGLVVYYTGEDGVATSRVFVLADAHGHNVGDIDHLFAENVVVKVILDVTSGMAYVQNADTNAYIERTFVKSINGAVPDENGNVVVEVPEGGGHVEGTFLNLGYDSANKISGDLNDYVTPGVYRYTSPNATVGTSKISNVPDTGINNNTGGFRLIVSELSSSSNADINSFMQTIIFDTPDYSTLQIWTRVHSKYGAGSGWSPWFKSLTTRDVQTMIDAAGGGGGSGGSGITPHIGDNGNWFIGETDTGKPSRGQDGETPAKGVDYFTPEEIQEIAEQAAGMVDIPEGGGGGLSRDEVQTMIDNALGVIENGTY